MEKIKMAICYDFDKTIATNNMQNFGLIKAFNMEADNFWAECSDFSLAQKSEDILTCMYMILKKCKDNGIAPTKDFFFSCGKEVEFFEGVETWFKRINDFADKNGVEIEHYIISSGLKEIIEGTKVAKYFEQIYACSYCYDEKGNAMWPAISINYTDKTQFLFRINKGIFEPNDNTVNDYMNHAERRIPFENFIYIGDSETDIPSMKLIRSKKGYAIGVYTERTQYYDDLINRDRVDYIAKADYSKDSELEIIIKEIIEAINHANKLKQINLKQRNQSRKAKDTE